MREFIAAVPDLNPGCRGWKPKGAGHREVGTVDLREMPEPSAVPKVEPEQIVEDILISTLLKVRAKSSPEIGAAAGRYLALIRERAL